MTTNEEREREEGKWFIVKRTQGNEDKVEYIHTVCSLFEGLRSFKKKKKQKNAPLNFDQWIY